jgi:transcriptional regulator with XRE-family HTH domain
MEVERNPQIYYPIQTMTWFERAQIIMKAKKIKQVDIVAKTGLSSPVVARYLHGERGADSIEAALKFATALDVDPSYLLFGDEHQRPVRKVTHKLVVEKLQKFELFEKESPLAISNYAAIRLLKDAIAAGHPAEIKEDDIDGWALIYASKEWMPHDAEFYTCARIQGYSMFPVLAPGDIVAIDHLERDPRALKDKMVAFRQNSGTTIKWLRVFEDKHLVIGEPENRDERESTIIIDADRAHDQIVGKVAWWWAKR